MKRFHSLFYSVIRNIKEISSFKINRIKYYECEERESRISQDERRSKNTAFFARFVRFTFWSTSTVIFTFFDYSKFYRKY